MDGRLRPRRRGRHGLPRRRSTPAQAHAASTACWSSACALSADDDSARKAALETLLAPPPAQPHRLRAAPAGHADQQHRGRPGRLQRAATTPTRASTTSPTRRCSPHDPDWRDKRDGQWLAEHLGIDPELFADHAHDAGTHGPGERARDERRAVAGDARLLDGDDDGAGASADDVARSRAGSSPASSPAPATAPAIRIGRQPYGILPATAFSRMRWLDRRAATGRRSTSSARLYAAAARRSTPTGRGMSAAVSYVGKPGDPHRMLLDIVGLHRGRSSGRSATPRACTSSTTGSTCRASAG